MDRYRFSGNDWYLGRISCMLGNMADPKAIGPAMAALLTHYMELCLLTLYFYQ